MCQNHFYDAASNCKQQGKQQTQPLINKFYNSSHNT